MWGRGSGYLLAHRDLQRIEERERKCEIRKGKVYDNNDINADDIKSNAGTNWAEENNKMTMKTATLKRSSLVYVKL